MKGLYQNTVDILILLSTLKIIVHYIKDKGDQGTKSFIISQIKYLKRSI